MEEYRKILKELVQHKGWKIYQSLLEQYRNAREKEKANFLRQSSSEADRKAANIQNKIDGSIDAEQLIYVNLPEEEEENPNY